MLSNYYNYKKILGIIIILYNILYFFSDPFLLDSIDNMNIPDNVNDNLDANKDFNYSYYCPTSSPWSYSLNRRNRIKRWIHWRIIGKHSGEYSSYEAYKVAWNPSISVRKIFKNELQDFIKNPSKYIEREKLRKIKIEEFNRTRGKYKDSNYLIGKGSVSRAELKYLNKKGLDLSNGKIVPKS